MLLRAARGCGWLTCVRAGVPLQLVTPGEPLPTEEPVADKGPLAGVQAHVGPQQGCLPESLATVGDMAHVLLLALLSRPGNWVEGRSGGSGKPRKGGGRRWSQDRTENRCRGQVQGHGKGKEDSPFPSVSQRRARGTGHMPHWWSGLPPPPRYLLSPSLQLGHVQAMRRRFSPGWASPARACSICSWICVGLSPLMVRLFPETFCTVSCCCPVGWGGGCGVEGTEARHPSAHDKGHRGGNSYFCEALLCHIQFSRLQIY